ncbi:pyruvate dehydrogenase [Actinomadura spongiicola]|uniref:Dihydrolipoamide acetyltransferase component of pyruvate dehydrogenase complex n=1 Tax=Actinomadura spongiicola TaxID=2303421 RepID=A0A372GNJ2_9ACTN|nr:2-oxo acid dehydrogenase subunit E2 [Actinomadura spongiicola]RFS86623.1 pyruvate dehydrogenase [Actinomadura spongiicola]
MTEIRVPKLNNNDSAYTLVGWLVDDGDTVDADTPVVELETSKAVEELCSPDAGVVRHLVPAGGECAPGDLIGRVAAPGETEPGTPPTGTPRPDARAPRPGTSGPVITAPARALLDELSLDHDVVNGLDVKVVRRADVERLAAAHAPSRADASDGAVELSPAQRAVARTVETSHRTIPAAYSVIQVDVDAVLRRAAALTESLRRLVGLPEFVVCAAARLHGRFPEIFATPVDGLRLRPATAAHVGVTIDVGRGLFVPVIADASSLGIAEIVEAFTGFRRTAISGAFRERDLAGANLVVALHQDRDIVSAVPIVFPGRLCALSLAGTRREVRLDADGTATAHTVVNIGLAYDHRFVNGREATLFLQDLKDALEDPDRLAGPDGAPTTPTETRR